jgi:hypothetical protein
MNRHQTTQKCRLAKEKNFAIAHKYYLERIEQEEREEDERFDEYLSNVNSDNRLARSIFGNK